MSRIIIDVREPSEFIGGHVDGAMNIPPKDLFAGSKQLDGLPKDTELILYCRTGSRSTVAMNILASKGYTNVKNGINKEHIESKYGKQN